MPADDADVRNRLVSLSRRAAHHLMAPTLDEYGQLTHRGTSTFLSPVERRLAARLIASFDAPVSDADLIDSVWLAGGNEQTLRVHVSRLRRRIAPARLAITTVRGFGYMLRAAA